MQEAVLITNLAAEATSPRVKEVIVKALSSDLRLEVVDTAAPGHATTLASEAARNGCELVVAFGGDGTMNEVANGLVGSDTPLAILPGGNTNVVCRNLGLPADIVGAIGHLLNGLRHRETRRISVGRTGGRCFLISCGAGLRAPVNGQSHPSGGRFPGRHLLESALHAAVRDRRGREPLMHLSAGDVSYDVVVAFISNTPQPAYVMGWPVTLAPEARLEEGLDVLAMRHLPLSYVPRLAWSSLAGGSHTRYKQAVYLHDLGSVRLCSSGPPFPVHLDGEFLEDRTEVEVEIIRDGLAVLV
ncbi:MAG TPA: diacylglycerol kinase family protein [Acidimicrobiia bacterium]|nr:diacylglycerol kinase family protein [Acidimicrobiia bacterium]